MSETEQTLIEAIHAQTKVISAYTDAVMQLIEVMTRLVDEGGDGEEPTQYLNGSTLT